MATTARAATCGYFRDVTEPLYHNSDEEAIWNQLKDEVTAHLTNKVASLNAEDGSFTYRVYNGYDTMIVYLTETEAGTDYQVAVFVTMIDPFFANMCGDLGVPSSNEASAEEIAEYLFNIVKRDPSGGAEVFGIIKSLPEGLACQLGIENDINQECGIIRPDDDTIINVETLPNAPFHHEPREGTFLWRRAPASREEQLADLIEYLAGNLTPFIE